MMHDTVIAFVCTLIAGLSTGIGSLIALVTNQTNKKFLSVSLGFSAGVMVYVSMIEIFAEARESLSIALGMVKGNWITVLAFFGGMLFIAIIDKVIPSEENPHEVKLVEEEDSARPQTAKLMRMGVLTALAIAVHNFPEGLATFVSALQEPGIAIPIVAAIAIHNIPEGMAVGISFAAAYSAGSPEAMSAAVALALGMGIQNIPEGTAVSLPMHASGKSRFKAFSRRR